MHYTINHLLPGCLEIRSPTPGTFGVLVDAGDETVGTSDKLIDGVDVPAKSGKPDGAMTEKAMS